MQSLRISGDSRRPALGMSLRHVCHEPARPGLGLPLEVLRMNTAGTTITWYGHACVEIGTPGGKVVLIDPWFANPRSPKSPDAVEACDVMLVTHGHSDHFGN